MDIVLKKRVFQNEDKADTIRQYEHVNIAKPYEQTNYTMLYQYIPTFRKPKATSFSKNYKVYISFCAIETDMHTVHCALDTVAGSNQFQEKCLNRR